MRNKFIRFVIVSLSSFNNIYYFFNQLKDSLSHFKNNIYFRQFRFIKVIWFSKMDIFKMSKIQNH
jgi:hypothetical protein